MYNLVVTCLLLDPWPLRQGPDGFLCLQSFVNRANWVQHLLIYCWPTCWADPIPFEEHWVFTKRNSLNAQKFNSVSQKFILLKSKCDGQSKINEKCAVTNQEQNIVVV